jgi:hypothetical protein
MSYYFLEPAHSLQVKMMFMGSDTWIPTNSIAREIWRWAKESPAATLVRSGGHLGPTVIDFDNKDEKLRFLLTWYNGKKYSIYGDFDL